MDFSLLAAMIFNLFLSSAVTDSVSFVRLTFSDVFFSSFLFISNSSINTYSRIMVQ